jgi:hypothetical protein
VSGSWLGTAVLWRSCARTDEPLTTETRNEQPRSFTGSGLRYAYGHIRPEDALYGRLRANGGTRVELGADDGLGDRPDGSCGHGRAEAGEPSAAKRNGSRRCSRGRRFRTRGGVRRARGGAGRLTA